MPGAPLPQKAKILHLSQAGSIGGVSRVIQAIVEEQLAEGYDVKIGMPSRWEDPAFRAWLGMGDRLVLAPFFDREEKPYLGRFLELVRWIRSEAPDVVHVHSGSNVIHPRIPLAAKLAGVRRRPTTIHHMEANLRLSRPKRLLSLYGERLSTVVTTTTDRMRQSLQGIGMRADKMRTVFVPVKPPGDVTPTTVEEVRRRYGLPETAFLVGNVSRFARHKGQLNLVKSVQRAAQSHPEVHLALVGVGTQLEEVKAYVRESCPGLVTFLEIDSELGDFMRSLDLFAHLASEEGFGLVYIEAALMGVPSLGTRVGGVPLAVLDGDTGRLVEFGDLQASADALVWMVEHPDERRAMGARARTRGEREFAPREITRQYLDAYDPSS